MASTFTTTLSSPPTDPGQLAVWFAEAVRAEITELEKKGREQRYELLSGVLVTDGPGAKAVYQFVLAEGAWVPEESSGLLEIGQQQYRATVVAQDGNRIHVQVECQEPLGSHIPRAVLKVDDLALLRKLADVLEEMASTPDVVGSLAAAIFRPDPGRVGNASLPPTPELNRVTGEQRKVIEQACASDITYVWGPPGTGKTYVIAHLINALVQSEERVLLVSHTHAAVDQTIYEAVKAADKAVAQAGPLAGSAVLDEGRILRIGRVVNPKVPESVRLDCIVERKAEGLQAEIAALQTKAKPLADQRTALRAKLDEWAKLEELNDRFARAQHAVAEASLARQRAQTDAQPVRSALQTRRDDLRKAERAWFFRARRVEQATHAVQEAKMALKLAEDAVADATGRLSGAESALLPLEELVNQQQAVCVRIAAKPDLERELSRVQLQLEGIETRISELQQRIDQLEQEVISGARVIACTLTKCYVGTELEGQAFDALIADEISMALPPLLFVAARRITRRVILVGDFKQLPPIVRSDNELSDARLRTDAFHMAGVARDLEPTEHRTLTRLRTQRRMVPGIADVARHISYGPDGIVDHEMTRRKKPPQWLEFLTSGTRDLFAPATGAPLLIVDTADLHCWCGRQALSLSRFNFYSATIAVELAAMAAAGMPQPPEGTSPPIGIVTPFAAQRRLLARLAEQLSLVPWAAVGTVHTFQGGEAELIIFDTVLDDPYWSARLCTPRDAKEVKRDLNVAVTRAKSKFVFLGSSEWLNKHARPASGLGQLWHFLKENAELISAHDLVETGFAQRVSSAAADTCGWRLPDRGNGAGYRILDESTFFDSLAGDVERASRSIFGLVPYFGEYRWPRVEPLFRAALQRGVEVTLVTPPASEADNPAYVEQAMRLLRELGAVVVTARGLHGKDIIIDEAIHYTGSLNWASHRGRAEIMHRVESPARAKLVLDYLQARHIREAAVQNGRPRSCPECGGPTQVVNQSRSLGRWDKQPMKIGCANYQTTKCKYLCNIDQRAPFTEPPRCEVDGRTKYRRVRRGKGEVWQCPKHPKECKRHKVVPGDP